MMLEKNTKYEISFIISESIYEGFIQLFNDKNPLHVNESFAIEKGFKGKVMHGNILNGFLSYFIGECLPIKNVIILSQEIKYNKPVYLNDRLLFTAQVHDIFESANMVEIKFSFTNSDSIKVAKGNINIGII
ncbi:MAG: MaoC/PaaZ C-terminal domain-containing protein [Deltaproteobacteria bacterium]|nr:MaoC/PaaZ C-terminal domain-containing protein [Deltaproteobacteria bacterium]